MTTPKGGRPKRDYCVNYHQRTPENLDKDGHCRPCRILRQRRQKRRDKRRFNKNRTIGLTNVSQ
jgi:hypothetical protein